MGLILLKEEIRDTEYLAEDAGNGQKNYYIRGPFLQAECKNGNGRWYPVNILEREVNNFNEKFIKENRAFGELGHPDTPAINLERVSHIIKELKKEGNDFIGKAMLVDTPFGKIAEGIIKAGGKLGVSSRGVGTLKETSNGHEVQDDFKLATPADIVANPSAPRAFVDGLLESATWIFNEQLGGWVPEKAEQLRKKVSKMTVEQINEKQLAIFEQFLGTLIPEAKTEKPNPTWDEIERHIKSMKSKNDPRLVSLMRQINKEIGSKRDK